MKNNELRVTNIAELKNILLESRQDFFKLRFQHTIGQLEKTSSLQKVRKKIARILTILREKD